MNALSIRRTVLSAVLLLAATQAPAEISKCKDANGQVTYTQSSCPPGTEPLELAAGIPRETGNSFPTDQDFAAKRMSVRAQDLRKKFEACRTPSSAECQEFSQLAYHCKKGMNFQLPECEVMTEFNSVFARKGTRQYAMASEWDRDRCRDTGDQKACERVKCPTGMSLGGTDAEIQACARFRSLPSSDKWAQVAQSFTREGRWQGEYLCLEEAHERDRSGELSASRPVIRVQDIKKIPTQAPTYQVVGKPMLDKVFQSREAAVEAACAASGDWWKRLPEPKGT